MEQMRAEIAMLERALKNGAPSPLSASEVLELCQRTASLMAPMGSTKRTMLVANLLQLARLFQFREDHTAFAAMMTLAKIIQTIEDDKPI